MMSNVSEQLHQPALKSLAEKWPSSFVARSEVSKFSGGILHPRTLANLDSQGGGPTGRVKIGNKVAYPVAELIRFLERKVKS
jgi:hypothetical protein